MKTKRILFLGGSNFQLAPVLYAKSREYQVFTCDYLPGNPCHQYADAYYNVSTTCRDKVLELAKHLDIDGIVAYASDPAAPTAAFVAEQLHLPGNPYESVNLLTRKDLFREFLRSNNFNAPASKSFDLPGDALNFFSEQNCGMMVKPVDSSGSKGVSFVACKDDFCKAFQNALSFSRVKKVIVEEFVGKKGFQIAGDGFIAGGRLVFKCFGQEHFNAKSNPFVPVGESFPLQLPESTQNEIHSEVQKLLTLLDMKMGGLNFDIILDKDGRIFLMEIGPRSGGNFIPEVTKLATGVDLAELIVESSIGNSTCKINQRTPARNYASYMIHAECNGVFSSLYLDKAIENNIVEKKLFINPGAPANRFDGSNHTLGYLILKYQNPQEMLHKMEMMNQYVRVNLT